MTRRELLVSAGSFAVACQGSNRPGGGGGGPAASGMVASSQVHANEVGARILRAGGNAADAAVAMAATLNLVEPTSTGIGGDCFALYFDAATRAVTALNGSGRAPARLSLELLAQRGLAQLPPYDALTITVPGACRGWFDLIAKHGSMPMSRVLAPAIELAERGSTVGANTAHFWERGLAARPGLASLRELSVDGRAPRAGETFRNPGLARTLRAIAEGGPARFYEGEIAEAIARAVAEAGGVLAQADLAAHVSTWDAPISTTYRGLRVWECPPNGQGITALIALNLLEGFELRGQDPLGPDRMHLLVEAMRVAFADTRWYVADPAVPFRGRGVPIAELLAKDYAAKRRVLIDKARAAADHRRGAPVAGSDTVYFCTVDGRGNACSFINSNYMGFGTGIVPAGWGFTLQNRGHNFSLETGHPNALAPNKRPYHTIIPGMLTRDDGSLYAPFGVMGGFMQPQGHVQVVVGLVDDGLVPQAVLDRPRFCIEPVDPRPEAPVRVMLETGIPDATFTALRERGHAIGGPLAGFDRALFGRGQIIRREAGGRLVGGSDPRADGGTLAE